MVNIKEVHIEKIIGVDSEDELDHDKDEQHTGRFTLRLYNEKQPSTSTVYLVIDNKQDLVSFSNMAVYFKLFWVPPLELIIGLFMHCLELRGRGYHVTIFTVSFSIECMDVPFNYGFR